MYCYGIFPFAFANKTPCYGLGQWGDFGVIGGVSVGVDGRVRLGVIEWRSGGASFYVSSEQANEIKDGRAVFSDSALYTPLPAPERDVPPP